MASMTSTNGSRVPNLSVILLNNASQQFIMSLESHKQLYGKYLNVSELSADELKEVRR